MNQLLKRKENFLTPYQFEKVKSELASLEEQRRKILIEQESEALPFYDEEAPGDVSTPSGYSHHPVAQKAFAKASRKEGFLSASPFYTRLKLMSSKKFLKFSAS